MDLLQSSILETVPEKHYLCIKKYCESIGPIETFFRKVYYIWTDEQKEKASKEISTNSNGIYTTILIDILKVSNTIKIYESHKEFIRKTYGKFRNSFHEMTEEQVDYRKTFYLKNGDIVKKIILNHFWLKEQPDKL